MKRILFIDDEPAVLESLRLALRAERGRWEMTFVDSAEAALAAIESTPFDVIVTDLWMPVMGGAALLEIARDRQPHAARIVLSGHSDYATARQVVQSAQQYLLKPLQPGALKATIEHTLAIQSLLQDPSLRTAVGAIGQLPPVPRVYEELSRVLSSPQASVEDVGAVVEKDPALCAKVLQLVNSAFFGLARRISSPAEAVRILGSDGLRSLALGLDVQQEAAARRLPGFDPEELQQHAMLTARIARRLLAEPESCQDAFIAGMLHDVGKLVMATRLPEQFAALLAEAHRTGQSLDMVETTLDLATHAHIGAYLLGIWGLPFPIVEAVAFHHLPRGRMGARLSVADAVYVSNLLAHDPPAPRAAVAAASAGGMDSVYLEAVDAGDHLPAWLEVAEQERRAMTRN